MVERKYAGAFVHPRRVQGTSVVLAQRCFKLHDWSGSVSRRRSYSLVNTCIYERYGSRTASVICMIISVFCLTVIHLFCRHGGERSVRLESIARCHGITWGSIRVEGIPVDIRSRRFRPRQYTPSTRPISTDRSGTGGNPVHLSPD